MKRLILCLICFAPLALLWAAAAPPENPGPDADGVYDARAFGARGDGIADDTTAIQAALDAAKGPTDRARGPVVLPPGRYRVTKPLRVAGVAFFSLRGAGKATKLYPVGKMDSVLDIDGVAFSTFSDFLIEGDSHAEEVQDAIRFYWDAAKGGRPSSGCVFRNILIQDVRCVTGFRIGKPGHGEQVDTSSYENIIVAGKWQPGEATWWQHGFYVGSGPYANNLVHTFTNASATMWANAFTVVATNFALTGASLSNNGIDFNAGTLSYFLVQGVRSEQAGRLLVTGIGPTDMSANFSLSDILWSSALLAPDRAVIRWLGINGTLAVRNLDISVASPAPRIVAEPWHSVSVILDGVTCSNTLDGFLDGATGKVDVTARGFTSENANGTGWRASSAGVVTSGPIRFRGGGDLSSKDGQLTWTPDGGKPARVAVMGDLPPPAPAPVRRQGQATIPRGRTAIVVEHGLGGQPAPEDVAVVRWPPPGVWPAGIDDRTLTFRVEHPAPAAGITFTWSASLR